MDNSRQRQNRPPRGQGRNRSNATRTRDAEKERNLRIKTGEAVVANYEDSIKKKLFGGFENVEEIIRAKQYETNHQQLAIPVSTRTIEFSIQETFTLVANTRPQIQTPPMTVYQFYRVMLALHESRIYKNRLSANFEDANLWYDARAFEIFKTAITSLQIATQRVGCLVRSSSTFKYETVTIVPTYPAKKYVNMNGQRYYLPVPECVTFTTLRETVTSLANPESDEEQRRGFRERNPLPRAQWDDHSVLTNPDDFMPAVYTAEHLTEDIY